MNQWIPIHGMSPNIDGEYLVRIGNLTTVAIWSNSHNKFIATKGADAPAPNLIEFWAPFPEMPRKHRWKPSLGETYWYLDAAGRAICDVWGMTSNDHRLREYTSVFKTKEEAEIMADKIRRFVTAEIEEA